MRLRPMKLAPPMHDMLVRLYDLPPLAPALAAVSARGIAVRRARAGERAQVLHWIGAHFPSWVAEAGIALGRRPVTCFVAMRAQALTGFACHDATAPNFFGPEGVAPDERGHGIGRALLLATLHAQREQGYAYAIIGGVGPAAFYAGTVGAVAIAGSTPGIYGDRPGVAGCRVGAAAPVPPRRSRRAKKGAS